MAELFVRARVENRERGRRRTSRQQWSAAEILRGISLERLPSSLWKLNWDRAWRTPIRSCAKQPAPRNFVWRRSPRTL